MGVTTSKLHRAAVVSWVTLLTLLGTALPVCAEPPESRRSVTPRPGVTQSFVLVEPGVRPAASVVLFPGGDGVLGFPDSGPFPRGGNFLVRNRRLFAAESLLVAVVDTPSDHMAGLGHFRLTADHARDVAAVIDALRRVAAVPVWLVGTSRGTISAVNAAARLREGGPDGLVITSSMTRSSARGRETVFDAGLADVRVPTLVVHSENDACVATPGADAPMLFARVRATRKELRVFGGLAGGTGAAACGAFSAHGYFGIDGEVVKTIADWIKATPAR